MTETGHHAASMGPDVGQYSNFPEVSCDTVDRETRRKSTRIRRPPRRGYDDASETGEMGSGASVSSASSRSTSTVTLRERRALNPLSDCHGHTYKQTQTRSRTRGRGGAPSVAASANRERRSDKRGQHEGDGDVIMSMPVPVAAAVANNSRRSTRKRQGKTHHRSNNSTYNDRDYVDYDDDDNVEHDDHGDDDDAWLARKRAYKVQKRSGPIRGKSVVAMDKRKLGDTVGEDPQGISLSNEVERSAASEALAFGDGSGTGTLGPKQSNDTNGDPSKASKGPRGDEQVTHAGADGQYGGRNSFEKGGDRGDSGGDSELWCSPNTSTGWSPLSENCTVGRSAKAKRSPERSLPKRQKQNDKEKGSGTGSSRVGVATRSNPARRVRGTGGSDASYGANTSNSNRGGSNSASASSSSSSSYVNGLQADGGLLVSAKSKFPLALIDNMPKAVMSVRYKDMNVSLSEDRLTVTGGKGWSSVLGTHCTDRGFWYFEVNVLEPVVSHATSRFSGWPYGAPQATPHIRVGWGSRFSRFDLPVGVDTFGYCIRDVDGSVVTKGRRTDYGHTFGPGDIVGCYIALPPPTFHHLDASDVCRPDLHPFLEAGLLCNPARQPVPVPSRGSKIQFSLNGKRLGCAFKHISTATYHPSVSLTMGARVRVNLGPRLAFPPVNSRYRSAHQMSRPHIL